MMTKQQAIDLAADRGSTATTFRGAFKFLRAWQRPRWMRRNGELSENGVRHANRDMRAALTYALTAHRTRLDRWMESRAQKIMAGGRYLADRRKRPVALLDREQYLAMAESFETLTLDVATALVAEIERSMCMGIAGDLDAEWPFRKAASKWAGGNHTVSVKIGPDASVSGGSEKVWSDNGKWSGRDSFASLTVTRDALNLFPTLRTPDGSIVLDAKFVGHREYELTWVEQSAGFDLKAVRGYLICGYHVQAKNLEAARRKAQAARQTAIAAALQRRQAAVAIRRDWSRVFVSLEDSISAGNCLSMSKQFADQAYRAINAVGPCAVRADVVLSLRDDYFVRRALGVARSHA